jgi:hypothetical protein
MSVTVLSEKVSYVADPSSLQIIVLGKIVRWKEALIFAWLLAWIFCGIYVIRELTITTDRDTRLMLMVFLFFWGYYLWRVGKVWLYRRGGNELIRIDGDTLVLKRSFFTYGSAKTYEVKSIENLKPIDLSKRSFAYSYENGWWILGGEKIGFDYKGRFVKFGMQLSDADTSRVYKLLKERLLKASKTKR